MTAYKENENLSLNILIPQLKMFISIRIDDNLAFDPIRHPQFELRGGPSAFSVDNDSDYRNGGDSR